MGRLFYTGRGAVLDISSTAFLARVCRRLGHERAAGKIKKESNDLNKEERKGEQAGWTLRTALPFVHFTAI